MSRRKQSGQRSPGWQRSRHTLLNPAKSIVSGRLIARGREWTSGTRHARSGAASVPNASHPWRCRRASRTSSSTATARRAAETRAPAIKPNKPVIAMKTPTAPVVNDSRAGNTAANAEYAIIITHRSMNVRRGASQSNAVPLAQIAFGICLGAAMDLQVNLETVGYLARYDSRHASNGGGSLSAFPRCLYL